MEQAGWTRGPEADALCEFAPHLKTQTVQVRQASIVAREAPLSAAVTLSPKKLKAPIEMTLTNTCAAGRRSEVCLRPRFHHTQRSAALGPEGVRASCTTHWPPTLEATH